jgi:hypothetical protein
MNIELNAPCNCYGPISDAKCHYFIFNPNVHGEMCRCDNNTFVFNGNGEGKNLNSKLYSIEIAYDDTHTEYRDNVHEYISAINLHNGYGTWKNTIQYNFTDIDARNRLSHILFNVKHKQVLTEVDDLTESTTITDNNVEHITYETLYTPITLDTLIEKCEEHISKHLTFHVLDKTNNDCICNVITYNVYNRKIYNINDDTYNNYGEYLSKMKGEHELLYMDGVYKVYGYSEYGISDIIKKTFIDLSKFHS